MARRPTQQRYTEDVPPTVPAMESNEFAVPNPAPQQFLSPPQTVGGIAPTAPVEQTTTTVTKLRGNAVPVSASNGNGIHEPARPLPPIPFQGASSFKQYIDKLSDEGCLPRLKCYCRRLSPPMELQNVPTGTFDDITATLKFYGPGQYRYVIEDAQSESFPRMMAKHIFSLSEEFAGSEPKDENGHVLVLGKKRNDDNDPVERERKELEVARIQQQKKKLLEEARDDEDRRRPAPPAPVDHGAAVMRDVMVAQGNQVTSLLGKLTELATAKPVETKGALDLQGLLALVLPALAPVFIEMAKPKPIPPPVDTGMKEVLAEIRMSNERMFTEMRHMMELNSKSNSGSGSMKDALELIETMDERAQRRFERMNPNAPGSLMALADDIDIDTSDWKSIAAGGITAIYRLINQNPQLGTSIAAMFGKNPNQMTAADGEQVVAMARQRAAQGQSAPPHQLPRPVALNPQRPRTETTGEPPPFDPRLPSAPQQSVPQASPLPRLNVVQLIQPTAPAAPIQPPPAQTQELFGEEESVDDGPEDTSPEGTLLYWVNHTMAQAATDIEDGRAEPDWVEIAVDKWPKRLFEELRPAIYSQRVDILKKYCSLEVWQRLGGLIAPPEQYMTFLKQIDGIMELWEESQRPVQQPPPAPVPAAAQ